MCRMTQGVSEDATFSKLLLIVHCRRFETSLDYPNQKYDYTTTTGLLRSTYISLDSSFVVYSQSVTFAQCSLICVMTES